MNLVMCEFGNRTQAYRDGKTFLVDIEDYEEFVDGYKFCLSNGYVVYSGAKDGLIHKFLHRNIMGDPEDLVVDHINGDILNNCRDNLRVVSRQENSMNQGINKNNKSGVSGVHWNKSTNKWRAKITYKNKRISLGCFEKLEDATKARKDAEEEYFGEFARK
tara:strand:+ start:148 stop:630 length:483 start_codon:yes stop_codon:yes gene_type:complete